MPGTAPVPDACRIGKSIVTAGAAIFLTRFTDISSIYIYIYSDAVFSSFLGGGEALLGWRPKDWLRISPDFSYISYMGFAPIGRASKLIMVRYVKSLTEIDPSELAINPLKNFM